MIIYIGCELHFAAGGMRGLMVKEEFFYDSRDGKTKIHAVRYLPDEGVKVKAVLQIVHGMAEYVERYEEFAAHMTRLGFVVTGEDHLGHGKSVSKDGLFGYFCEQDPATVVVRDVHRLKKSTQTDFPDVPYILMGHSMGSFIARNYIFRYGTGIDAAVIMGTGMPSKPTIIFSKQTAKLAQIFCGSEHIAKFIDKLAFGGYTKTISHLRTPWDWLSRDEERVDAYIADPLCGFTFTVNGFRTLFELIDRLHSAENLSRVPKDLPILMVSGSDDPVGAYGKGVKKAYESLKNAGVQNVTMHLFEGGRHELLNETNREEIMEYLSDWLVGIAENKAVNEA